MLNKMFGYITGEAAQGWRKLQNDNKRILCLINREALGLRE
jgi:hypothetical protein